MSRKSKLSLPPALKEKFAAALGGKTPTTDRLLKLLERKEPTMEQDDIEAGREPYTATHHLAALPPDVPAGEALSNVAAAQQQRVVEGRARVADRIDEHRARGLDPLAPPLDPEAAKLAAEPEAGSTTVSLGNREFVILDPPAALDESAEIERLKSTGTSKLREVAETLERQVLQRMPQIRAGGSKLRSLEEAAEILIAELQPNSIDAIRQVCAEHTLEPWVVILGAVERMAVLQELHAGEFDPEWMNRQAGGSRPTSVREQKCETCQGVLPAEARRGQKYCCSRHGSERLDHNDDCPLKHLELRQGRWVDTRGIRA